MIEKLLSIYRTVLEDSSIEIDLDTDLSEKFTSFEFVQLIVEIESAFGIQMDIDDLEYQRFSSVRKAADLISGYLS